MNFFPSLSRFVGFAAVAGSASMFVQGIGQPVSAKPPIQPVYTSNFTETYQNTPADSPNPTSFGFFFETNKTYIHLNALAFPFFAGWANEPGNPTLFPNADKFDVYVWRIDGINQPSLAPCDGSTPYCQVAKVTFDQNLTSNYTVKDGYYWQEFEPINLGKATFPNANVQYAVAAVGNFRITDGLPTLVGGNGTFDPAFAWTGNGFNGSTSYYDPDFSADFPVPWNFTDNPPGSGDPESVYAYFSPNLSYAIVPSPLPLLGAGAALGWARRLRRRVDLSNVRS